MFVQKVRIYEWVSQKIWFDNMLNFVNHRRVECDQKHKELLPSFTHDADFKLRPQTKSVKDNE